MWEAECVTGQIQTCVSDIEGHQHKPTNAFSLKAQVGLNVLLGCQTNCLCICKRMLFCFIAVLSCWCWKQNWSWWRVWMKLVVWIWSKLETYLISAQVTMWSDTLRFSLWKVHPELPRQDLLNPLYTLFVIFIFYFLSGNRKVDFF